MKILILLLALVWKLLELVVLTILWCWGIIILIYGITALLEACRFIKVRIKSIFKGEK